jgi:hypothetical protein
MPVSSALQRLLSILNQEELLRRRELEWAQGELAQLEHAMKAAGERQQNGRRLIACAVRSNDLCDRLAGMEEVQAGRDCGAVLQEHIHRSNFIVEDLRTALLSKQVERKQTETLIEASEAREAIEADRQMQKSLDDRYLSRFSDDRPKRAAKNRT